MPTVDLNLQLKFLMELNQALSEALVNYAEETPEKIAELKYMKSEVTRARRIVEDRLAQDVELHTKGRSDDFYKGDALGMSEVAYS